MAAAQQPADPTWPCIQREVDHLSLGALWPSQVSETFELSEDFTAASARLALRRVGEEEAASLVDSLAAAHPDLGEAEYGRIFADVLERIDRERSRIIAGIGRYAANQVRLASEIEELRSEMAALEAADEPDFDRMDEIEAETDWRERVLTDRNRALTYVCESPVLLEQRAYAIAQILLAASR